MRVVLKKFKNILCIGMIVLSLSITTSQVHAAAPKDVYLPVNVAALCGKPFERIPATVTQNPGWKLILGGADIPKGVFKNTDQLRLYLQTKEGNFTPLLSTNYTNLGDPLSAGGKLVMQVRTPYGGNSKYLYQVFFGGKLVAETEWGKGALDIYGPVPNFDCSGGYPVVAVMSLTTGNLLTTKEVKDNTPLTPDEVAAQRSSVHLKLSPLRIQSGELISATITVPKANYTRADFLEKKPELVLWASDPQMALFFKLDGKEEISEDEKNTYIEFSTNPIVSPNEEKTITLHGEVGSPRGTLGVSPDNVILSSGQPCVRVPLPGVSENALTVPKLSIAFLVPSDSTATKEEISRVFFDEGLWKIEPFKSNKQNIGASLKKLPYNAKDLGKYYKQGATTNFCNAAIQVFYNSKGDNQPERLGFTFLSSHGNHIFIESAQDQGLIFAHEMGHLVAGLVDEYIVRAKHGVPVPDSMPGPNCVSDIKTASWNQNVSTSTKVLGDEKTTLFFTGNASVCFDKNTGDFKPYCRFLVSDPTQESGYVYFKPVNDLDKCAVESKSESCMKYVDINGVDPVGVPHGSMCLLRTDTGSSRVVDCNAVGAPFPGEENQMLGGGCFSRNNYRSNILTVMQSMGVWLKKYFQVSPEHAYGVIGEQKMCDGLASFIGVSRYSLGATCATKLATVTDWPFYIDRIVWPSFGRHEVTQPTVRWVSDPFHEAKSFRLWRESRDQVASNLSTDSPQPIPCTVKQKTWCVIASLEGAARSFSDVDAGGDGDSYEYVVEKNIDGKSFFTKEFPERVSKKTGENENKLKGSLLPSTVVGQAVPKDTVAVPPQFLILPTPPDTSLTVTNPPNVAPEKAKATAQQVQPGTSMSLGNTRTLTLASGGGPDVIWTSSSTTLASVTKTGDATSTVTALASGKVTITASRPNTQSVSVTLDIGADCKTPYAGMHDSSPLGNTDPRFACYNGAWYATKPYWPNFIPAANVRNEGQGVGSWVNKGGVFVRTNSTKTAAVAPADQLASIISPFQTILGAVAPWWYK